MPRASIRIAKGTPEQNYEYCSKEGDYQEDGDMPKQGMRSDLQSVREFVRKNTHQPMRLLLSTTNTNYQGVRLAEKFLTYCEPQRDWLPEVHWYYGKSGSGKTRKAFQENPDAYFKTGTNDWWDGYDGHEVVIIDEFRKDFCKFHELLKLLNGAPYRVAYKGGFRQFLAKKIIFTSCYHPEDVYSTHEDLYQLMRRITNIVEFK